MTGCPGQREDLLGHAPFLLDRESHRRHDVGEIRAGCRDTGDLHRRVDVEQVLHHHHRVVALLERLAIEEGCRSWHRQRVVEHRTGDVLMVCGELVPDLLVELRSEPG